MIKESFLKSYGKMHSEQRKIENKLRIVSSSYYSYIGAILAAFILYHLDARY